MRSASGNRRRLVVPAAQLGVVAGYLAWLFAPPGWFPRAPMEAEFLVPVLVLGGVVILGAWANRSNPEGHLSRLAQALSMGALGIAVLMLAFLVLGILFFILAGDADF